MATAMSDMNRRALAELGAVIDRIDGSRVEALLGELSRARRIALYGVGREGLMMKALAMRLFHMGLDAHVVGDMTTPPLGNGDLLVVSAGPGRFSTVEALAGVARGAGVRVLCFSAQPDGAVPRSADLAVILPAQTMASDTSAPTSILPMGSLYEGVMYLFFEYLVLMLRDRLDITAEKMRANHTNLE